MKTMTRLGKGVIGAVVSFALFIGCLPITAIPVLAATTEVNMPRTGSTDRNIGSTSDSITINDDGGSGNYSNNCNGTLRLTAPDGYYIKITGVAERIRNSDYLRIYDGQSASGTRLLESTSATNQQIDTQSSGRYMTIVFTSNDRTNAAGFTLTATIAQLGTIDASATGFDGNYDNRQHGITVSVTTPARGYTIKYGETEGTYNRTSSPTYTTGTHTVYYQVTAPGYKPFTGSANVVIHRTISATATGYDGAYTGGAHGITVRVTSPMYGYSIAYGETAGNYNRTTSPTYTTGNHTVYYQVTANGYDTLTGSADVNISNLTISADVTTYNGNYDGEEHGISVDVTAPSSGATVLYSETEGVFDPEATTSPAYTTGNHTVYYQISATGYDTLTSSAVVNIVDIPIAATATGYNGNYDGRSHGITVNVTEPTSGYTIMYGETEGTYNRTTSPSYTTGTHTVYYRVTAPGHVELTGSAEIVIVRTISATVTGYDGNYDGRNHRVNIRVTDPTSGATIRYGETEGTYNLTQSPRYTTGNHTVYYQITATGYETLTGSATVNIADIPIVATVTGYDGNYDGRNHRVNIRVTDPTSGATIRYGETEGTYNLSQSPQYTTGNHTVYYQITATGHVTLTGSATVNIADIPIVATATGYNDNYDGQEHGITVRVTSPMRGATIRYGETEGTYNLSSSPTYTTGNHTVYYQITATGYITETGSAEVNIANLDIAADVNGFSGEYDGEAHGITVDVTAPTTGATVMYGVAEGTYNLASSPTYTTGTNTVYYQITATGYNTVTGSATVSISDIDIAATAEGYDGPYDGEAHGITVTVTEPESGASVMFGTEEGTYDMEVSPVFTEIGDYTVYYQVTAEGHNPLTGSATVSIGELTIDATVTPYDGVFDGAEHGVTVTVNTPEVGATVLFGTEAGVYDLDESPTYCEIGTYTVYYKISAEYYAPLEGSVVVRISENPDRDDAREALIELIAASDEILGEWEDLLPEDLVEALLDAEDAAYEVLNNEIASIEQLEAAADNLANALGNVLQYIAENYETEPELTPEQRTRLCVINFVENLYLHALGRPFDVSGRDTWVSLIMDQGGTGTQVARGFLGSQEFLGLGLDNEGFVKALYNALFNRVPEAEEVDTWTNALAAGVTREEVINAFFASPEWARTCAYYRVNI